MFMEGFTHAAPLITVSNEDKKCARKVASSFWDYFPYFGKSFANLENFSINCIIGKKCQNWEQKPKIGENNPKIRKTEYLSQTKEDRKK